MRIGFIVTVWLAGVAFGITATQKWDQSAAPKDQSRLNRVPCGAGDTPVVDATGNVIECYSARNSNSVRKG